jgi:hypothetical protein
VTRPARLLPTAIGLAAAAFVASQFFPAWRAALAAVAALLLFVTGAARVASWAMEHRPRSPTPFERMLGAVAWEPERPPDLVGLERTLSWRRYSRRDFHHRVRPVLRRLTAYKLLAVRGVDLEAEPQAARALLPDDLRWLVGDDLPEGVVTTAGIARMLDAIEAL